MERNENHIEEAVMEKIDIMNEKKRGGTKAATLLLGTNEMVHANSLFVCLILAQLLNNE